MPTELERDLEETNKQVSRQVDQAAPWIVMVQRFFFPGYFIEYFVDITVCSPFFTVNYELYKKNGGQSLQEICAISMTTS